LPLALDTESAAAVRAQAMQLANRDPGFASLRAKIHSFPDGGDAERVREFAEASGRAGMRSEYESLAEQIERLYAPDGAANAVLDLAPIIGHGDVARQLREKSTEFQAEVNMGRRFAAAAKLMRLLRESFPEIDDPEVALKTLMTSLALEREAYAAGAEALTKLTSSTRRSRLWLLAYGSEALYGAGFLGPRQLAEVEAAVKSIESRNPTLRQYREVVLYLARVPEWTGLWLEFLYGPQIQRWAPLEPLARQYVADRLRGSPLLFYSGVLDTMVADANERAGVVHEVMGERVAGGFRALNPGLARGVLRTAGDGTRMDRLDPNGIYVLPETTPDISPVSGILTRGAGSSVSHVQLLARNLGIPNVLVHEDLVPRVAGRSGARAVLAVSPGGAVRLAADGSQWDAVFGAEDQGPREVLLQPDMLKIDLATTTPIPLANLRAVDAGRVCGPKGANLGELRAHFSGQVPDGFVIPFGAFRRLLDQPIERGGPPAWTWLQGRYDEIQRAGMQSARGRRLADETLARLRDWIAGVDFPPSFATDVEWALRERFGPPGRYGVFVRSDTNVEDLPGFTGAGLNRTVPNVVGNDAILAAIREVWASPFSERSYAWRQAHMADPENVFPSVVVQQAFPSEKSGVLVTVDVETGSRKWLTVVSNEGVGGAVEGQAAETLLVNADTGVTRLLSPAATPTRRVLSPRGGIVPEPASGTEWVLQPGEVRQLVRLAREVPQKLPSMRTATGEPIPADVEFAFRGGRLALLQIRPFNESKRAQRSQYLAQLDAPARARDGEPVWIGGVPGRPDPAAEAAKQEEQERVAAEESARKAAERRDRERRGIR
ncbi:MAG TPA: PEP/pyruvate-binding domain-containing protein, partial [Myxococcota bacterium]|nr:PEP/pyruvate-binding domain-containing protein [Myxococcota bacterium]